MNKTKKLSLLVMAAGMGSRYGGVKQIDGIGPNNTTIMDYSLFDALREGFSKVVFVVREEIQSDVEDMFFSKLKGQAEVHCTVQSLEAFVPPQYTPVSRSKPWGTAHAMLCGKTIINEPFAVINADDFYGRASFASLARFLHEAPEDHHAMVGYTLQDVLSTHGSVTRGLAKQGEDGLLVSISEVGEIIHENGQIVSKAEQGHKPLDAHTKVSMNSWGFTPGIFDIIEKMFSGFLEAHSNHPKAEFYIGDPVNEMIRKGLGTVHVISGGNTWFGVTYKEDKSAVLKKIQALVNQGIYPQRLW